MLKRTDEMTAAQKEAQPRHMKLVRQMHDVRGWDEPPWTEAEEQGWVDLFREPEFDFGLYKQALYSFTRGPDPRRRPTRVELMERVRELRGLWNDTEMLPPQEHAAKFRELRQALEGTRK